MLARFFDTDPFTLFDAFERQMSTRARSLGGLSVTEDQDAFHVVAALPGFKQEDVQITLEGDVLTLKATRKLDAPSEYKLVRSERGASSFERQVSFASPLAADAIDATLEDGVLTIKLPKAPEAKPRRIALKGAPAPTELS
ncbi:MAG: Hsp20/alpha crystallin family protein [Polyangiaceae bacterium]